jgi:hypothetical protein
MSLLSNTSGDILVFLLVARRVESWLFFITGIIILPSPPVQDRVTVSGWGMLMQKVSQSRLHFLEFTRINDVLVLGGQQS